MEFRKKKNFIFDQKNYRLLGLALGIIILGFVLMSGGGSEDPSVFNPEIFNFQRIRLAPTFVLVDSELLYIPFSHKPSLNGVVVGIYIGSDPRTHRIPSRLI